MTQVEQVNQVNQVSCPRIVIAGTNSGVGKTTIVAGILRCLVNQGYAVQAFKVGPDYIDPGFHKEASGRDCYNLDTWLVPAHKLTDFFAHTTKAADLAVIEGVMGLYDGGRDGISSTADIAKRLKAPVVLVIDCKAMGESAAAIAKGFRDYDKDVQFGGVILNRIGSQNHETMIRQALERLQIPVLGVIHRDERMKSPERHLGLTPVTELDVSETLRVISECMAESIDFPVLIDLAHRAVPLETKAKGNTSICAVEAECTTGDEEMDGVADGIEVDRATGDVEADGSTDSIDIDRPALVRIGIAYDEAFSFYYPASLDALAEAGAELVYFSPLKDKTLPNVQALVFGGGFPEMFLNQLSQNEALRKQIKEVAQRGMPIYAECGGLMYLCESVVDFNKQNLPMVGIVPATCTMQETLQRVGYVEATALTDTVLVKQGQTLRGHEFHFSTMDIHPAIGEDAFPWAFRFEGGRQRQVYKGGYRTDTILASYLHINFAGHEEAVRRFIEKARRCTF